MHFFCNQPGGFALIETLHSFLLDAAERRCEIRLAECVPFLEQGSIPCEDAHRGWKSGHVGFTAFQRALETPIDHESILGQLDGGPENITSAHGPVIVQGFEQSGNRARDARCQVSDQGLVCHIPGTVDVHRSPRGPRGPLPKIDDDGLPTLFADEHETSSADIPGFRKDHGEHKTHRDSCVDRAAPFLQNIKAGLRGQPVGRHHHGVPGTHRCGG